MRDNSKGITCLEAVLLLVLVWSPQLGWGWSDDLFYFTSFQNVSEWGELYPRCNSTPAGHSPRYHLTPVAIPKPETLNKPPPYLSRKTLQIYNYRAPPKHMYSVSFAFPNEDLCLYHKHFSPCYIAPKFTYIRSLILGAVRPSSVDIRDTFGIEPPEGFGSLLTGEEDGNEKFFVAALFLGSADEKPNDFRSTHTIDGKGYPMEIYMLFADEELAVTRTLTMLVVLVDEQAEDNPNVAPVVKAVKNHLVPQERQFLKDKLRVFQRERMFHHKTLETCKDFPECTQTFRTPAEEFKRSTRILDEWQEYQYYETRMKLDAERKTALLREVTKRNPTINGIDVLDPLNYEFWLLPALARYHEFNIDWNNPDIVSTTLRHRLLIKLSPEDEEKEKDVQKRVVKYLEFLHEIRCTRAGNLDPVKVLREWKTKASSNLLSTVEQAKVELKKGENAHPFVLLMKALNDASSKAIAILYQTNKDIARDVRVKIEKFNEDIRDLVILERDIEKIDESFALYMHEAGHHNVTEFLEKVEAIRLERIRHYEVDESDTHDEADEFDSWEHQREDTLEAGGLGLTHAQEEQYTNLVSPGVSLTSSFQITWLIPKGGGYIIYKGNMPVPPCFRTETTYVFKQPIKMSKQQIRTLTTIPTSWLQARDIRSTFSKLHQPAMHVPKYSDSDKPIPLEMYFERRNHLTLGDDGVHHHSLVASAERKKRKEKPKKRRRFGRNSSNERRQVVWIIVVLLIPVLRQV